MGEVLNVINNTAEKRYIIRHKDLSFCSNIRLYIKQSQKLLALRFQLCNSYAKEMIPSTRKPVTIYLQVHKLRTALLEDN